MAKKKIRDSAYYEGQLAKKFPVIFADMLAGKYKNVHQAAIAAGLKKLPSRLDALKRQWKKINSSDKKKFIVWAKTHEAKLKPRSSVPLAGPDGRLRSDVRTFLADWLLATKSRPARIMKEIGLSGKDVTLWGAIKRDEPVKSKIISLLGPWLEKNGFHSFR
jgi:hypothetical protein